MNYPCSRYPSRSRKKKTLAGLEVNRKSIAAGRITLMDKRRLILLDETGTIEVIVAPDADMQQIKRFDIIEAEGFLDAGGVFRAECLTLLVPYKGGDADVDSSTFSNFSRRRELFQKRAEFMSAVRDFFNERGFLETETPTLLPFTEATVHISPFDVEYADDSGRWISMHLQTSPEHAMKRLLAEGFERIYQICRFYRNGEFSKIHSPEFVGLEWYEAYSDYRDIMETTEQLVAELAQKLLSTLKITRKGKMADLTPPWTRISVSQLFKDIGIDLEKGLTRESLFNLMKKKNYDVSPQDEYDDLFFKCFINDIEQDLGYGKPVILYDYPLPMGALARESETHKGFAERFEFYIAGLELGNGYTELNDPVEQGRRFLDSYEKKYGSMDNVKMDEDFLKALERGMPPAGGIAVGLERLFMLFMGAESIHEVQTIAFKPEKITRIDK